MAKFNPDGVDLFIAILAAIDFVLGILKLAGVLVVSWWIVTMPLWIFPLILGSVWIGTVLWIRRQ